MNMNTPTYSLGFISDTAIRDIAARALRRINGWRSARLAELHRLIICRAGEGWCADAGEFDLVNMEADIHVRLVDRVRSLGIAASRRISLAAQTAGGICCIVETAATGSTDEAWHYDGSIRRLSIGRLYTMVFGSVHAYPALAAAMPRIIADVTSDTPRPNDPLAVALADATLRRLCPGCA